MPLRVQPIYTDNPGPLPATYTLPPRLDLEVSSIRARVNGAGAAGAFIVVCETLTIDGRIMTQSRIDQQFAVGDTGALTWAPFLRRAKSAAPGGNALQAARINQPNAQSIPNQTDTVVLYDTVEFDNFGFFNPATPGLFTIATTGIYVVAGYVQWAANATGFRRMELQLKPSGGAFVSHTLDNRMAVTTAGWTTEQQVMTIVQITAASQMQIIVRQASGAALNVNASQNAMAIAGLGPIA